MTPPPIEQFEKLIQQQANYCQSKLPKGAGIDRCDLLGEAALVYCKALEKWDSDRGVKFITYFHLALRNHYILILRKAYKQILWQALEENDPNSKLHQLEDNSWPSIHGHLSEQFYQKLTRRAVLFIRELFYSSEDYIVWESEAYKTVSHVPRNKMIRVSRFLKLTRDQMDEIVIELREKLTED